MVLNVGHGPFRFLDRLKAGAEVRVYTQQKVYTYQVREQVVVEETDSEVVANTVLPQLTLITCSNWSESEGDYLRRRAVFADLVQVQAAAPVVSIGQSEQ
jgi:LPXTG-site transpeptidase (sortase) family protein